MTETGEPGGAAAWHKRTAEETLKALGTSRTGLTAAEAALRLGRYGPNSLKEKPKLTALAMFFGQFKDFMIAILIAAAAISGAIGERLDAAVIAAIIILNAIMGFMQEYRAQKAMDALRKMAAPAASVLRSGTFKALVQQNC
ncbi:MAG TPA: cation-transporting P-type ATPase [Elusimicrobiales bacterium]|nr:cation-transporting P-type ATPase [Elusimicrobiales bacterium]